MRLGVISSLVLAGSLAVAAPAHAIAILPQFLSDFSGPDDDPLRGDGNIQSIFAAAADLWELAILDDTIVTIPFGWVPGESGLGFTDGTGVFISRENRWFLDSTPQLHDEYTELTSDTALIDGIALNYHVGFTGGVGEAGLGFDLFSVMLHEIGHVLSFGPNAPAEWQDGSVGISAPLPLAGLTIPMHLRCCHMDRPDGYTGSNPLMFPFFNTNERRLISDADLLFVAQSGGWQEIDTSRLTPVPEPGTFALLTLGAVGLFLRRSRTKN